MPFHENKPPVERWVPTSKGVHRMMVIFESYDAEHPIHRLSLEGFLWSDKLGRFAQTKTWLNPLGDKFYGTEAEARLAWSRYRERVITMRKNDLDRAQAEYDRALKLPA